MIDTALACAMVGYAVAMALNLVRLFIGPAFIDRILALDTLYVNALATLVMAGLYLQDSTIFEIALVIALLGFVSTMMMAKYVLRRDIIE